MLSGDLSAADFLAGYWQRRPVVIRQLDLPLPAKLNPAALFGHAADERLSSRLISGCMAKPRDWQVDYGPFDDDLAEAQPDCDWTLLVQDLDKVRDDCAALLQQFDFLPRWRLDDVMASYAAPGGTVGPHVDQYDVFLIQLHGRRRWQWNAVFNDAWLPDLDLRILQSFLPADEAVLEPGDALYLPPGVAHHGIAETGCITLSVGLRAPGLNELLGGLAEHWPDDPSGRYADPDLSADESNELGPRTATRLRAQLLRLGQSDNAALLDAFGRFITHYRLAEDLLEWPDAGDDWPQHATLQPHPAARLCWQRSPDNPDMATLYCHGEAMPCPRAVAMLVCARQPFTQQQLITAAGDHTQLFDWLTGHGALRRCDNECEN